MKSTPKWLLIPPVVALLLVLGPLAMGGGTTNNPLRDRRCILESMN